ncbi:BRO-N domain-containing protein [Jiella pacifica]|uniref:Bro-N domain-containing protein n=1 Tax=Jiella pacifica TaxID=2696469 RepID=A0A6N9T4R1_9HYPH|nr:BRO family protein [Jiella pacifica]NDW03948.1 hypothetical protein [Jiella pacifica]
MKTNLSPFDFNGNGLRVIDRDGEPWFVAADVCRSLGFKIGNDGSARYLKAIGSDEKFVVRRGEDPRDLFEGVGRRSSHYSLISESGLYKLVMRSDKPEAKAFQDWVTKEVLPAIRKDGRKTTAILFIPNEFHSLIEVQVCSSELSEPWEASGASSSAPKRPSCSG